MLVFPCETRPLLRLHADADHSAALGNEADAVTAAFFEHRVAFVVANADVDQTAAPCRPGGRAKTLQCPSQGVDVLRCERRTFSKRRGPARPFCCVWRVCSIVRSSSGRVIGFSSKRAQIVLRRATRSPGDMPALTDVQVHFANADGSTSAAD